MLIFAMDQLIVLKEVRIHSATVLGGGVREDDKKGKELGEKAKRKTKQKVTTD